MVEVYVQLATICGWLEEKTKKEKQQAEFVKYMISECSRDNSLLTYEYRLFTGTHIISVKGHLELVAQIQWKDAKDMAEKIEAFMELMH